MPPQSRERGVCANDKHDITIIIIIQRINDKFRMLSCTVVRRRKYKIQNNSNNNKSVLNLKKINMLIILLLYVYIQFTICRVLMDLVQI